MAAPSTITRVLPDGIMLCDGHSTLIAFEADPDIDFMEITVQPPGIDGGDPIDNTTMHNVAWRTMCPRQLKTLTEFQVTASWDPDVYNQILALINIETNATILLPDGSTLDFFCFIKGVEFSEHTEGERPIMTITVVPTNQDPSDQAEAAPVLTSVPGT